MTMESRRTTRSARETALSVILAGQLLGVGALQYYAWAKEDSAQLRFYAASVLAIVAVAIYAVWSRRSWAPWIVLVAVSLDLVSDAWSWAEDIERTLIPLSVVASASAIVLVFISYRYPASERVTRAMKVYFAFVLLLAGVVGFWGYLAPANVDAAIPFSVPPLHARFLGAMYLSGATFMILGIRARSWAEVRVMVPMIAIWTGMLGVVSLLNLEVFDWSIKQTWIWWAAYTAYPLIAAWIAYQQRGLHERGRGPHISSALRGFLYALGAVVTVLALALLIAPGEMAERWPWPIPPVLAHVYSAPFLSYGLGSLYAATRGFWNEVRIPVYSTLVFTVGVLIASVIHRDLFDFSSFVDVAWFAAFALASLGLGAFAAFGGLRTSR